MNLLLRARFKATRILSNFAWEWFYGRVRKAYQDSADYAQNPQFVRQRFLRGQLSAATCAEVAGILAGTRQRQMDPNDHPTGYLYNHGIDRTNAVTQFQYYDLSYAALKAMESAIEQFSGDLTSAFGTPWRNVNVRAWSIEARDAERASNAWHTDQFNAAVLKVLVYPQAIDEVKGTTEVRMPDGSEQMICGPPGTYLVFDPTLLMHRGVPPRTGVRDIIEMTFVTSMLPDRKLVAAGLNAIYPLWPWPHRAAVR